MSKLFVPNEILRVFKEYYPDADLGKVEWSWEIPGKIYEAEFEQYDVEYEVEITVTGHLLLSEIDLELEDLPEHILDAAKEHFGDYEIDEATMIQYSNGDLSYELQMKTKSSEETEADEKDEDSANKEGEKEKNANKKEADEDKTEVFEVHFRDDGQLLIKGEDL